MGMDFHIYSARNREIFKHYGWWESEQVQEEFYARKPWDWVENCDFIPKDYENGEFIELTEVDMDKLIEVACRYKDYFGTYDNVPQLCELRDRFFGDEERPVEKLFLEYDF